MAKDELGYQELIRKALLGVVREVLLRVANEGLPGGHFFYISFRSDHPAVVLPQALRRRFPEEMTVVLQHQYWDLEVEAHSFGVTLAFDGARKHLTIPFDAVRSFADPSVPFALRFDVIDAADSEAGEAESTQPENVISLDRFRKKE